MIEVIDNGNPYIFCDYPGCVRGAGHNSLHLLHAGESPIAPVLLTNQAAIRDARALSHALQVMTELRLECGHWACYGRTEEGAIVGCLACRVEALEQNAAAGSPPR